MRVSVLACALGVLGVLGGGWLVGRWCLGLMLIVVSVSLAAWALFREDGVRERARPAPTVHDILERARRAS